MMGLWQARFCHYSNAYDDVLAPLGLVACFAGLLPAFRSLKAERLAIGLKQGLDCGSARLIYWTSIPDMAWRMTQFRCR